MSKKKDSEAMTVSVCPEKGLFRRKKTEGWFNQMQLGKNTRQLKKGTIILF